MHADVPRLNLALCSVLRYAHTAHFLHMRRLAEEVVGCASGVLRDMAAAASLSSVSSSEPRSQHDTDTDTDTELETDAETEAELELSSGQHRGVDQDHSGGAGGGSGGSGGGGSGGGVAPLSPWDAIAALTLLGDPQQVLSLVSLKQWYTR